MPQFSVIIPLYNKAPFIRQTLQSVLDQTFSDFEVIVINDGSTDHGEAIVRSISDPRITCIATANEGVSNARNRGITMAHAPYITFLDADDLWKPDFLAEMRDTINAFPEESVFAAAIEKSDGKSVVPARYSIDLTKPRQMVDYFEGSMRETAICTSCAVFARKVFDVVGGFDPRLPSGQDTDMWIRIGLKFPVVFVSKILATYVFDPESLSKNSAHLSKKADFSRFDAEAVQHLPLRKFLDYNHFSLALRAKLAGDKITFKTLVRKLRGSTLPLWKTALLHLPVPAIRTLQKLRRLM